MKVKINFHTQKNADTYIINEAGKYVKFCAIFIYVFLRFQKKYGAVSFTLSSLLPGNQMLLLYCFSYVKELICNVKSEPKFCINSSIMKFFPRFVSFHFEVDKVKLNIELILSNRITFCVQM